jgi:hypothetical protein
MIEANSIVGIKKPSESRIGSRRCPMSRKGSKKKVLGIR